MPYYRKPAGYRESARRLFDDEAGDRVLKLVDSTTLATEIVILKYEPHRG